MFFCVTHTPLSSSFLGLKSFRFSMRNIKVRILTINYKYPDLISNYNNYKCYSNDFELKEATKEDVIININNDNLSTRTRHVSPKKKEPTPPRHSSMETRNKNIKILSDSIPRGLRMREFNHYVHDGKAHLKAFPGATAKHLHHYSLPTLKEDHPDTVIVHVGFNDLSPKDGNLECVNTEEVSKEIIEIGRTCVKYGATSVFISSIIRNRNHRKQLLIDELNAKLKQKCETQGFIFIEHNNIRIDHLWKDGIHLNEPGKEILANNFIDYLNDFLYNIQPVIPNR